MDGEKRKKDRKREKECIRIRGLKKCPNLQE